MTIPEEDRNRLLDPNDSMSRLDTSFKRLMIVTVFCWGTTLLAVLSTLAAVLLK